MQYLYVHRMLCQLIPSSSRRKCKLLKTLGWYSIRAKTAYDVSWICECCQENEIRVMAVQNQSGGGNFASDAKNPNTILQIGARPAVRHVHHTSY